MISFLEAPHQKAYARTLSLRLLMCQKHPEFKGMSSGCIFFHETRACIPTLTHLDNWKEVISPLALR